MLPATDRSLSVRSFSHRPLNYLLRSAPIRPICAVTDLGRVSALQLASAKRAAVMLKLVGEVAGLTWMAVARTPAAVLWGGALIFAGQAALWLRGAGEGRGTTRNRRCLGVRRWCY